MTNLGHQTSRTDARRRRVRAIQLLFAGAAAVAALALFSGSPHIATGSTVATAPFATDDTNFVNDNGQTSGDIFTQNAQDQN
jgi:hypothetical protein